MKNIHGSLTQRANATGRGQVMIEFALVLPVIVLILLGTMDLARAVYAYGVMSNAARDGAHWGSLRPSTPAGDMDFAAITQKTRSNTKTLDQSRVHPGADCFHVDNPYQKGWDTWTEDEKIKHKCDSWNIVTVTVEYDFQPITLFFVPIKLKSVSTMTIE